MQIAGIQQIPVNYINKVKKNSWPYVVAYHFGKDPHEIMEWDNDSILEALASLKLMGVIK